MQPKVLTKITSETIIKKRYKNETKGKEQAQKITIPQELIKYAIYYGAIGGTIVMIYYKICDLALILLDEVWKRKHKKKATDHEDQSK